MALAALALGAAGFLRAPAQDDSAPPVEELVVNQAAGRVITAVVKGGIVIATVEDAIEPGTRLPAPIPIASNRVGIILGADQWVSPSAQPDLGRLDLELPHIRSLPVAETPHLAAGVEGGEASDIEAIGKPLRDRIAELAGGIHSNVNWPADQPLVELILADYLSGYGPEVWQVTYALEQEQQQGDYWVTNVERPVYTQIWPPEKGQPHTLMEFDYPVGDSSRTLLDRLRARDSRLDPLVHGDPQMADAASKFLSGQSTQIPATEAVQFLRAALTAIAPPDALQSAAIIREETGFDWILAPPTEPRKPRVAEGDRPPGAPTLVHPQTTP
jgi:hypothetical protein